MGKLPAFQFYPGDWTKDAKLRSCSHAAKGALIDIFCLMFDCDQRGVLATNGHAWTDEETARAIGADVAVINELTIKGVLKRVPKGGVNGMVNPNLEGALYSARMVADERKRSLCAEAGKRGGNPLFSSTLKGESKGAPKGQSKRNPFIFIFIFGYIRHGSRRRIRARFGIIFKTGQGKAPCEA
jgi:hypothetical protein